MKKTLRIITAVFAAAIVLVLYPFFANIYNNWLQGQRVSSYTVQVESGEEGTYAEMIEAAEAWNEELSGYIEPSYFPDGMTDSEIYESLLDPLGDGMMGYVVIPEIDVNLPIYHYTTDEILQKGAGHMEATALPVGGEGTHCVITAHRGLPNAEMFTYLDKLEIGDVFYLKILNETYAYEVIEIHTVDPDETELLLPREGQDLCTLLTCTPYGVNSDRLLVTGERTEYTEEEEEEILPAAKAFRGNWYLLAAAAGECTVYVVLRRRLKRQSGGGSSVGN